MNLKRITIYFLLIYFPSSCVKKEDCNLTQEDIESTVIPDDLSNFWDLCPALTIEQAKTRAKENSKDILIIFYATIFSGNDMVIWSELNKPYHFELLKAVIICPLNTDEKKNKDLQEKYTNSRELASLVFLDKELNKKSNVLFFQGSSRDKENLTEFIKKHV
ncbi:MAG: hypothetical protein WDZ35_02760 [Crocinitomicaceae bacterium]